MTNHGNDSGALTLPKVAAKLAELDIGQLHITKLDKGWSCRLVRGTTNDGWQAAATGSDLDDTVTRAIKLMENELRAKDPRRIVDHLPTLGGSHSVPIADVSVRRTEPIDPESPIRLELLKHRDIGLRAFLNGADGEGDRESITGNDNKTCDDPVMCTWCDGPHASKDHPVGS